MLFRTLSGLALAATLSACAATTIADQAAVTQSGTAPAISLDTLKGVTQELSTDAFQGRAPTTAGEEKTVALIAERFRRAGLQPGNKGSWYQNVPLVETNATPTPLRITGGAQPITLNYRADFVANSYQVEPRIDLTDSKMVFVGYGINAPERGWNDYAGVDVKGKTVIILVNDPDYETTGRTGPFEGRAMTYYGRWTYK